MVQKLYILVRTDMDSMTVGRIAAQASHAANQFVGELHNEIESKKLTASINTAFDNGKQLIRYYDKWVNQTKSHFGTVIVLNAKSKENIESIINNLHSSRYFANFVIDPEYPIRDGNSIHVVKDVLTCAYVFPIHGEEENEELSELKLL